MNSGVNAAASFSENTSPAELSDVELLAATRRLVGRSNQVLASLLTHLAEVEARGLHRTRACSGLYPYCIYELRLSEDEAYRRVAAARLVRRFPALRDSVAAGELHLTGLLMLGPHLTEANLGEVLARAKHRTKKEIARLVRLLDPLPDVPPRIEPLGPALARQFPEAPTWSAFAQSMCPVRELTPGEQPRDWVEASDRCPRPESIEAAESATDSKELEGTSEQALLVDSENPVEGVEPSKRPAVAPARLEPQRYSVQFTAGEEYVKLVEEARALLSHAAPRATLDELHLRAMRALVEGLKRRKYAVTAEPRERPIRTSGPAERATKATELTEQSEASSSTLESEHAQGAERPRRRGRHVPAAVRRAVFGRDEGRCTYTDTSGNRCCETHSLELHHLTAFAREGAHTEENLTLRCRAHNALAAEEDLGREFIELQRAANEHDPWPGGR